VTTWLGMLLMLALAGVALLAPLISPYDPRLSVGPPLSPPSSEHVLGTNDIGQDVLAEWLFAARPTLVVAGLVTVLSTALSWTLGIAAGAWSRAEAGVLGLADLLLALPSLPLFLFVLTLVGPTQPHIIVSLGLLSWPLFARIVRGQVLDIRGAPFVEAARALGATQTRIAVVHILPATLPLLPAKLLLTVRFAVFSESTLAFLGLGDPSVTTWGSMLGWAFAYPLVFSGGAWLWWIVPPAVAIALLVLATAMLARGFDRDER
jgi:peptide/nickel transport system permease protein